MNLVDTHAHLYWDSFKEDLPAGRQGFDEMIQRALDSGVSTIINVGVDLKKSKEALEQTKKLQSIKGLKVYSTIGIHPHEAVKYGGDKAQVISDKLEKDLAQLETIHRDAPEKVVAVGECGLDLFFDNNPDHNPSSLSIDQQKALQRKLFQAQIDLAKKLDLPLIVHCRDDRSKNPENSEAWDKVLEMVGDHPTILHCYSGLSPTTQKVLSTSNLIVSFAATITYPKNEYLREAAKLIPLDRIVLETDCPFLPPQSKRGQRNEPANVKEIAQLIAELKATSLEEVAEQTSTNSRRMFNI